MFLAPGLLNTCWDYNRYKYGLEALNGTMQAVGESALRSQYGGRRVVYLLGELDNDPGADDLDRDCPAMLQGDHRLERGIICFNYGRQYYGLPVHNWHTMVTVPGVGHSAGNMFRSPEGVDQIFHTSILGLRTSERTSGAEDEPIAARARTVPA